MGGGGGRRGMCRAHKIIMVKHMTQGRIQDLEKGGGGHKGACGVYCSLTFIIINISEQVDGVLVVLVMLC